MPVHLFGQPCEMEPIVELAAKYNLKIIEDCAEAHFATYKEKPVGSFSEVGCFSTYVAHTITTGVGGVVTTNDRELMEIFIVNSTVWVKENIDGDIDIADKKFVMEKFSAFPNFQGVFHEKLDKQTLLRIFTNEGTFPPLGTRIFKRKFLVEQEIKFKEKIGDDAEILFTIDAIFQTDEIIFIPNIFYLAPRDKV